jgi:hypothetical protein
LMRKSPNRSAMAASSLLRVPVAKQVDRRGERSRSDPKRGDDSAGSALAEFA